MPEILTESFCERCGTRYTFESAAPRAARLKGIKVLSRGLKNFVMSDDTSMDEAMAAARSETDREVTSQQLDAFHKTFNFCMSCRQYTCGNCWNEAEGQCLSCAPNLGREILPAPFPDLDPHDGFPATALHPANGTNGANGTGTHEAIDDAPPAMAWPTSDLMREADAEAAAEEALASTAPDAELPEAIDAAARLAALSGEPVAEAVAESELVVESAAPAPAASEADTAGSEPDAAEHAAAEALAIEAIAPELGGPAAVDPADVDGRAAAAASQTTDLFRRFRPGQSLDDEIAAYEREQAAAAAAGHPTPGEDAPSPVVLDATSAETAAPEPIAPTLLPTEVTEPSEPVAASADAREDVVEQPTWRIVAPEADEAASTQAPAPAAPPAPTAEPQWPAQPEWPSQRAAGGLPFLGRPEAASGGIEALWAESAREVAAVPGAAARATTGVQPCVSCGLSLSATARFCRRCGTRQG